MASEVVSPREYGLGKTHRQDQWWAGPAATALGLGLFGIYATWRAVMNANYQVGVPDNLPESAHLLSPFYSPLLGVTRLPDPLGTRRFSPDLLLLSQSLLPGLSARSTGVCCGGTAQGVRW